MMNAILDERGVRTEGSVKRAIRVSLSASSLCVMLAIAALCAAQSAFAAGGVKAAYVEAALPSKPFTAYLRGDTGAGPTTGVLGITSLTAYNSESTPHKIYIFVTEVVGPTCNSAAVSSAGERLLTYIVVPAQSQVHLTFPSPFVVEPISGAANGLTCLRRTSLATLDVMVNGFAN
jgi:hypothetical protein